MPCLTFFHIGVASLNSVDGKSKVCGMGQTLSPYNKDASCQDDCTEGSVLTSCFQNQTALFSSQKVVCTTYPWGKYWTPQEQAQLGCPLGTTCSVKKIDGTDSKGVCE